MTSITPAVLDIPAAALAAADYLAHVVARYFETRYPGVSLVKIYAASLPSDETAMAKALYSYRSAKGWPNPDRLCVCGACAKGAE